MDENTLNLSIRKFLKSVGVSSQRDIEHAVWLDPERIPVRLLLLALMLGCLLPLCLERRRDGAAPA